VTPSRTRKYFLAFILFLLTAVAGQTIAQSVPIPPSQPSPDGTGGDPTPNCIPGVSC
jgi:hypothetical protein